ncbi:hypothetical protein ACWZHB_04790 [Nocardia sp. FBN12]|uniref:hypothetical protein n=1 Tax=Nocardia sp. FBN12 TaxID=3419766 RepID=UPI003D07C4AD
MPDDPRSSEPAPDTASDERGDSPAAHAGTPADGHGDPAAAVGSGSPEDASAAALGNMPAETPAAEEDSRERRVSLRNSVIFGITAIGAVILLVIAFREPPPASAVTTDRLGPAPGEQVEQYLVDARKSLGGGDADQHWALVSFTEYVAPQQLPAVADGLRISGVIQHVPIDRVQTPVITVATPGGDEPAVKSGEAAAGLVATQRFRDQRSADIARVTASRLRAGCACTAGIVVRGTLPQLRDLATQPGIRAVQALPPDAVAGRFAVSPLLPGSSDTVTPVPDDGPVPTE